MKPNKYIRRLLTEKEGHILDTEIKVGDYIFNVIGIIRVEKITNKTYKRRYKGRTYRWEKGGFIAPTVKLKKRTLGTDVRKLDPNKVLYD